MSLEGVLSDFGVGEIFQLIGQQRKTGALEVRGEERVVEVSFVEGQVLRARPLDSRGDSLGAFLLRTGLISDSELGDVRSEQEETTESLEDVLIRQQRAKKEDLEVIAQLLTEETIFELFLWGEGRFAFRAEDRIEGRLGDRLRGAEGVLLDALRMKDEWSQIEGVLPDFGGVPFPIVGLDGFTSSRATMESSSGLQGADLERLFMLTDGRLTVRRVIDLSRLGTFNGARAIVALVSQRLIRIELKPAAGEESAAQVTLATRVLPWLGAAFAPLAIALLLLPAPRATSFPVGYSPLADARAAEETRRLRVGLEVARWVDGKYPTSLMELRVSPALLAGVPLDQYSYARNGAGYQLERHLGTASRGPGPNAGRGPDPISPELREEAGSGSGPEGTAEGAAALETGGEPASRDGPDSGTEGASEAGIPGGASR